MVLKRFEDLCKERGEYPTKVAAAAGYDKSALTNWRKQAAENDGVCNISSSRLAIIAKHLETTSDYLLGISDENIHSSFHSLNSLVDNPRKLLLLDEAEGMTDKSLDQAIRAMRLIKGLQD